MRKKLLFLATVAIAALASCSKTEIRPEVESRDVHFVVNTAENEVVKSFIEVDSKIDGRYNPMWSKGDELAIFIGDTKKISKATGILSNINEKGETAKFDGTITGITESGTFKSFAPASAFEKGFADGTIGINLAKTQKPSSLTIDEGCDILVAKEAPYTVVNGAVEINGLNFKRMFSIVKIALNGPATLKGEKVQQFSLTAPEGTILTGRAAIDLSTATIDNWTVKNNTVTATYTTDAPSFGGEYPGLDNVVWLVVNPCTIASGAKVVLAGETAGYTFSKEVTLPKDLVFPQSQLAVINLTLDETNCTKKSAVVPVYASVAELIADGKPTEAGTKVTVTLTDEEITKFYKSGKYTNGVYFMVGTQEVQIYCWNTPSDWEVGGTISGTLTNCEWKLYVNKDKQETWELCPADYSELTYKAPLPTCATPVITIAENGVVSITCETDGATIHYTVGGTPADPTEADAVFSAVTLTDGQTIKAIAVAEGFKPSAVASKKYTVGGSTGPITVSKKISEISGTTTNGIQVSSMAMDDVITLSASTKGNNGKVYNEGAEWRLYQSDSGTMTVSSKAGYVIESITVTFTVKSNGTLKYGENKVTSGKAVEVSGSSVVFTVGAGQVKVTAVSVTYKQQ